MQAAKARLKALKASPNKKDRATHDRERSTYAAGHAHQHEFAYLWLDIDMFGIVPEWMHTLDLNDAYLFFKHVTLKHCDTFTRVTGRGGAADPWNRTPPPPCRSRLPPSGCHVPYP